MNGRTGRNNMDGSLHNEMAGTTEEKEAIKFRKKLQLTSHKKQTSTVLSGNAKL